MLQDSNRYYNVNQTLPYPYNQGYYNNSNFAQVNNYRKAGYTPNITFGQNPIQPATTQNKKSFSGSDVAKDIGILTGIAIACDFLFCKGKHVKQLANGVDDLFNAKKGTSVKTPSKPTTTQPVKNPVVETPATKVTETIKPTVSEAVVTKPQVTEIANPTVTQPAKTPVVETINPKVTEPVRTTASEITNVEKLNPNISYQEAHGAKVFADEKNMIIRQL